MATAVVESYLETIYNMSMEGEPVIAAQLARHFGVSRATVSETVKRLLADGYVAQHDGKHLDLTPAGAGLTERALRRHRLTERLLFDILGMDWVSAHEQAHALEHWISEEVEERMSSLLGSPRTCPHGNPIPGNAPSGREFLREQEAFRLADAGADQIVRVVLISELVEDESEVLRRLAEKGVYPGASLRVVEADPASAIVFAVDGHIRSVSWDLAGKIWVATGEVS